MYDTIHFIFVDMATIYIMHFDQLGNICNYHCQTCNIRGTLVGIEIVDHSDAVEASLVGVAPTASSFSTWHPASVDWAKTTARRYEKHISFSIWMRLILESWLYLQEYGITGAPQIT